MTQQNSSRNTAQLNEICERFRTLKAEDIPSSAMPTHQTYAITNFCGGVGKTTLAYNLAYLFSRDISSLFIDLSPQCDLSQRLSAHFPTKISTVLSLRSPIVPIK